MSELLEMSSAFAGVLISRANAVVRAAMQGILFPFRLVSPNSVSRCLYIARSSKHFGPRYRVASPRLDTATKRQPQRV